MRAVPKMLIHWNNAIQKNAFSAMPKSCKYYRFTLQPISQHVTTQQLSLRCYRIFCTVDQQLERKVGQKRLEKFLIWHRWHLSSTGSRTNGIKSKGPGVSTARWYRIRERWDHELQPRSTHHKVKFIILIHEYFKAVSNRWKRRIAKNSCQLSVNAKVELLS